MFREMRKNKQQLPEEVCIEILKKETSGVLAVAGDNDYPYAVPLSYVYSNGKLYFHCAKTGHKLDAITKQPKVSFCVIEQDEVVPEKYTTNYRSVIAFGKAHILTEETEIKEALEALTLKYVPNDNAENRHKEIESGFKAMSMVVIEIEKLTGKEGRELAQKRAGIE